MNIERERTSAAAAGSKAMLCAFLDRIGFTDEDDVEALLARDPNKEDLRLLLHSFLKTVPFENLGQHAHPGDDGVAAVPASRRHLPSLETHRTLRKIVCDRRGGFCWELNFAFGWLLRSLGYAVRYGIAHVCRPDGTAGPGHLCLYVDGLGGPHPLHVDPGFGDAPREPLPTVLGHTVTDAMIGDEYTFVANDGTCGDSTRFGQVLMRGRRRGFGGSVMVDFVGLPETPPPDVETTPPEPVYLLNFDDDLAFDCEEFQEGLATVLAAHEHNPFSQKRMCIMMRETGFDFVGEGYVKEIRHGVEVRRDVIEGEAAYRATLEKVAGIRLG